MGRSASRRRRTIVGAALVAAAALALSACVADLGTLGGPFARPAAVAADGTIVGTSIDEHGFERAFVWDPTTAQMHSLDAPGGVWSHASGVNRAYVVGWVDTAEFRSVGVVWSHDGRSSPLRHDGHDAGIPLATSENGFIAGYLHDHATPAARTGAIWGPDSELYTFAVAGGSNDEGTTAQDVNSHIQAVGNGPGGTAFVWDPVGGVRLLDRAGHQRAAAAAINDGGTIVGQAGPAAGSGRAAAWDAATGTHRTVPDLGGTVSGLVDVNGGGMAIGYTWDPDPDHPLANAYCVSLVTDRVTDLGRASVIAINDDGVIAGSIKGRAIRWSADTCPH